MRLKGSTALDHIKIIKISGGTLADSYLAKGFILDKSIGTNQPKRMEKAKIMVANSPMDTDKIKVRLILLFSNSKCLTLICVDLWLACAR